MNGFTFPTKHPADTLVLGFDFGLLLDNIAFAPTVTVSVFEGDDPAPENLLVETAAIFNNTIVTQKVTAGLDDVIYLLLVQATDGVNNWAFEALLPVGQLKRNI